MTARQSPIRPARRKPRDSASSLRLAYLSCDFGVPARGQSGKSVHLRETVAALAPRGRLILVGLLAGSGAQLDLRAILTRRLHLVGTVLRSRPLEEKIAVARAAERHLLPLLAEQRLRPVIDDVVSMGEVRRAAERMGANDTFGKLVLRW